MQELEKEKLGDSLEKYVKIMEDEISRCDEKLNSGEVDERQSSELKNKKQELEKKIEKAKTYLDMIRVPESRNFVELGQPKKHWGSTEGWKEEPVCERYGFRYDDESKSVTLDITKELNDKLKLNMEEKFYVAEEMLEKEATEGGITIENESEIFLKSHLVEEETSKGKIIGATSGIGAGAAGGAALGAGAMVALSPWTFGLSLSLIPAAATIGAVAGSLGGVTTGLVVGSIFDQLSNSEKAQRKEEIKSLLEDYKTMMEEKSRNCQDIISGEASTLEEKEELQKQKENYDNEVREMKAYIEDNSNWK
jgi:hypothetical protein